MYCIDFFGVLYSYMRFSDGNLVPMNFMHRILKKVHFLVFKMQKLHLDILIYKGALLIRIILS